ncbi:MAG: thermostable hemolysin [Pseudomonadota bacterium]|nr:thermostable hemolysin [Pseudomonadota bacterium]
MFASQTASHHLELDRTMHALARISPAFPASRPTSTTSLIPVDSPRRGEAESFIQGVFAAHYAARVATFTPDVMLLEQNGKPSAAAGWRGAASGRLFLESYLEQPAEALISRLAGHQVAREKVVEVGHLAALQAGGGVRMILTLAAHLDALGYEWVIFTATRELIGIFAKMGLPPLALAVADPARLGEAARDWGRYYDTRPIVVAGRIRLALEKMAQA